MGQPVLPASQQPQQPLPALPPPVQEGWGAQIYRDYTAPYVIPIAQRALSWVQDGYTWAYDTYNNWGVEEETPQEARAVPPEEEEVEQPLESILLAPADGNQNVEAQPEAPLEQEQPAEIAEESQPSVQEPTETTTAWLQRQLSYHGGQLSRAVIGNENTDRITSLASEGIESARDWWREDEEQVLAAPRRHVRFADQEGLPLEEIQEIAVMPPTSAIEAISNIIGDVDQRQIPQVEEDVDINCEIERQKGAFINNTYAYSTLILMFKLVYGWSSDLPVNNNTLLLMVREATTMGPDGKAPPTLWTVFRNHPEIKLTTGQWIKCALFYLLFSSLIYTFIEQKFTNIINDLDTGITENFTMLANLGSERGHNALGVYLQGITDYMNGREIDGRVFGSPEDYIRYRIKKNEKTVYSDLSKAIVNKYIKEVPIFLKWKKIPIAGKAISIFLFPLQKIVNWLFRFGAKRWFLPSMLKSIVEPATNAARSSPFTYAIYASVYDQLRVFYRDQVSGTISHEDIPDVLDDSTKQNLSRASNNLIEVLERQRFTTRQEQRAYEETRQPSPLEDSRRSLSRRFADLGAQQITGRTVRQHIIGEMKRSVANLSVKGCNYFARPEKTKAIVEGSMRLVNSVFSADAPPTAEACRQKRAQLKQVVDHIVKWNLENGITEFIQGQDPEVLRMQTNTFLDEYKRKTREMLTQLQRCFTDIHALAREPQQTPQTQAQIANIFRQSEAILHGYSVNLAHDLREAQRALPSEVYHEIDAQLRPLIISMRENLFQRLYDEINIVVNRTDYRNMNREPVRQVQSHAHHINRLLETDFVQASNILRQMEASLARISVRTLNRALNRSAANVRASFNTIEAKQNSNAQLTLLLNRRSPLERLGEAVRTSDTGSRTAQRVESQLQPILRNLTEQERTQLNRAIDAIRRATPEETRVQVQAAQAEARRILQRNQQEITQAQTLIRAACEQIELQCREPLQGDRQNQTQDQQHLQQYTQQALQQINQITPQVQSLLSRDFHGRSNWPAVAASSSAGAAAGASIGSAVGGAVGSVLGPIGTAGGQLLGGALGTAGGSMVAGNGARQTGISLSGAGSALATTLAWMSGWGWIATGAAGLAGYSLGNRFDESAQDQTTSVITEQARRASRSIVQPVVLETIESMGNLITKPEFWRLTVHEVMAPIAIERLG